MWQTHLFHLLGRAWGVLISELSTSTLSVIVFSVAIPSLVFLVVGVRAWRTGQGPLMSIVQKTISPTLISAAVTLAAWAALFAWAVIETVYTDHVRLVSSNETLLKEKVQLQDRLDHPSEAVVKAAPGKMSSCATITANRTKLLRILSGYNIASLLDPKYPEMSHVIPFYHARDKYESDCASELLGILSDATWPIPAGYERARQWVADDDPNNPEPPFSGIRMLVRDVANPPEIGKAFKRALAQIGVRIELKQWRSVETIVIVGSKD